MECFDIAVIGGDQRLAYMVPVFQKRGYKVLCYGTEKIREYKGDVYARSMEEAVENADIVAAGIPLAKGDKIFSSAAFPDLELEDLSRLLKKDQMFFAGVIPKDFREFCQEKEVFCYDFMDNEPLAVFNAIATAEGAILESIRNQPTNLHGSKALVLGYGRCGKVLGQKLKALDVQVTVCCRREEARGWAKASGLCAISFGQLEQEVSDFEYIYNTVPALVLKGKVLKKIRKDALVLELASKGGGIDREAAQVEEIRIVDCPGLPGRYAPKVSGEKLAEFILSQMSIL